MIVAFAVACFAYGIWALVDQVRRGRRLRQITDEIERWL